MRVTNIYPITQLNSFSKTYIDGRPCFSPDGNSVLFERKGSDIKLNQLWLVDLKSETEQLYYSSDTYSCLRASWSWNPNQPSKQIAFTGIDPSGTVPSKIMLLDEGGSNNSAIHLVVQNYEDSILSYPAWYANEESLLITNYSKFQLIKASINNSYPANVVTPDTFWSGMGTVSPVDDQLLAYAGQPATKGRYNQKINKVMIQDGNGNNPTVFSSKLPKTIGRTPWFNPDGTVMAFEHHSETNPDLLQICLKQIGKPPYNDPIVLVSNPNQDAEHPKFSPDGTKLVWMQNTAPNKFQIFIGTIEY